MSTQLPEVARAMLDPHIYPDNVEKVELMQTQMSFVFLAGKYVYKVKKPVDLGYLDYTTLDKRRFFCDQEVKLNRRLCPEVYLGVDTITRGPAGISLAGEGEVIDYAVKMLYLPQERNLNILLEKGQVTARMIEDIASRLVEFHAKAETSPAISEFGKIKAIRINTDENFSQTAKYTGITISGRQYNRIRDFSSDLLESKAELFNRRVADGRIRDCHGDLYSQHICFANGICIYDCIEFNERFRYCDVASEIAFLAMDLDHYGRADLSRTFINRYLALSSDHQIAELLKFYKCYRAYVRGKVSSFKYEDPYILAGEKHQAGVSARGYFALADSYSRSRPFLFITVGLVGSGKTTLAQALAQTLGLTVISSDVVRKQLATVPLTEHHFEEMESGIYSSESTRATYEALFEEARMILKQGDPVILDASFIRQEDRRKARELAVETGAEFYVLECTLDEENTRLRLMRRLQEGAVSDGRWEIYGPQKKKFMPVTEVEPDRYFIVDTAQSPDEQIERIIKGI